MAGYSGTPLAKKLGIAPAYRVALSGAPADFSRTLGGLPNGARLIDASGRGPFELVIVFASEASELRRKFPKLAKKLLPAGALWAAWPKKSSGVDTDLSEPVVREIGLANALVDNKVCAIDDVWSGLRFVVRLRDRPATKPARARR